MDNIRRNIAASIACRAAIKINMRLDQNKMEWLLGALAATDCPMSCPHGRPIALQYPTREILKAFIVFELRLCRLLDCTPGGA
jgi:DNA mismatch repair protein MutL